jgi:hypothetical protein
VITTVSVGLPITVGASLTCPQATKPTVTAESDRIGDAVALCMAAPTQPAGAMMALRGDWSRFGTLRIVFALRSQELDPLARLLARSASAHSR